MLWSFYQILSYPSLWLAFLLISGTALLPDVLIKTLENVIEKNRRLGRETSISNLKDACLSDRARKAKGKWKNSHACERGQPCLIESSNFSEQKAENMSYHVNKSFSIDEDVNGFEMSRRYRSQDDDVVSSSIKSSIYQYGYKNPRGLYNTAKLSSRVYHVTTKSRPSQVSTVEIRI